MRNRIILILLSVALMSCETMNPFESEGDYTEKRIDLAEISSLKNLNSFKISLVEDEQNYILFKGGENVIKKTQIDTSNSTLIIDHSYKNAVRNLELIEAEIHLKSFMHITVDAPANICCSAQLHGTHLDIDISTEAELVEMKLDLNYESMKFHSRGSTSGGYTFTGICPKADYTMNGITNIFASSLKSEAVSVGQNGIADAHLWVSNSLKVTIYNSGDIYYKGKPTVQVNRVQVNNQNNSGQVIPE